MSILFQVLRKVYLMTRTTDDRREDGSGRIISGESGLAHAGAIVAHQSGNIFVAHLYVLLISRNTEMTGSWQSNRPSGEWKIYFSTYSEKLRSTGKLGKLIGSLGRRIYPEPRSLKGVRLLIHSVGYPVPR